MRIYLDTSVFSAYYDNRVPERVRMTRQFWVVLDRHEKLSSELVVDELKEVSTDLREKMLDMTRDFKILKVTSLMQDLAHLYVREGIVPSRYFADALHIAIAVLGNADVLISWNFSHLVKRSTRLLVNSVNAKQGIRTIEILAPPEIQ